MKIMIHKMLGVTIVVMCLGLGAEGQNRHHDDRSLQERASRLEPLMLAAARRYRIDARILRAICFVESRYRIEVVSPKGARGPMQFMPETAARYGLRDPHDPAQAIDAAARYFRDLLNKFDGRIELALAAYNAGEGAVLSFLTGKPLVLPSGKIVNARGVVTGGIPPYVETRKYVRTVFALINTNTSLRLESSTLPLRSQPRRDFTLDAFDDPNRDQKLPDRRPSHFIVVH